MSEQYPWEDSPTEDGQDEQESEQTQDVGVQETTRDDENIHQYPEVYKVIGAPGTGKTTRVVGNPDISDHTSLVEQNMDEYPLGQQMIVTFTNSAVDEAADRLYNITDYPKYQIEERVTTIHSRCFQLLNLDRDQVVQYWHKQQFCDAYDLDFGYEDDDGGDVMADDKNEGNALFEIYDWLKSNRYDNEDYHEFPREPPDIGDVEHYLDLWDEWKDDRNLIGFGDMIEKVVDKCRYVLEDMGYGPLFGSDEMTHMEVFEEARQDPDRDIENLRKFPCFVDTKVMYVDEVQDLTPLQWAWYLAQKLVCEKVYVGGDDDQTIYGWSGADPNFMLDEEGDFEVLDRTYRIPANIWECCDNTISKVDRRQEKDVTPDGDGGEVVKLRAPSPRQIIEHLDAEENFILFRANYMIDKFCQTLQEQGIPYRNESTFDTWSTEVETIRDALAKIEHTGEKLNKDEVQALKENVPDIYLQDLGSSSSKEDVLSSLNGKSPSQVKTLFDLPDTAASEGFTWQTYLENAEELNYYEKQCIRGSIIHKTHDLVPDTVKIGTIHSAKGREAPNVILALDTTQSIAEGMREETMDRPDKRISDAERRVYYVGMSRASEKLVLAEGVIDATMTITIEDLIGSDEPAGYDLQNPELEVNTGP